MLRLILQQDLGKTVSCLVLGNRGERGKEARVVVPSCQVAVNAGRFEQGLEILVIRVLPESIPVVGLGIAPLLARFQFLALDDQIVHTTGMPRCGNLDFWLGPVVLADNEQQHEDKKDLQGW